MAEYATKIEDEGTLVRDGEGAIEKARALHHLATGDPEPERGGVLTGPATVSQPRYDVRVRNGQVEIKRAG